MQDAIISNNINEHHKIRAPSTLQEAIINNNINDQHKTMPPPITNTSDKITQNEDIIIGDPDINQIGITNLTLQNTIINARKKGLSVQETKQNTNDNTDTQESTLYATHRNILGATFSITQNRTVFELAREAGAQAFQFFISGERPWPELILREEFLDAFLNERMESKWNRDHIFVHGHLHINLASALEENLKRAERLFMSEIKGCEDMGIRNYILHPGSPKKKMDHQTAIKQVARLINAANKKHPTVKILIENMAGQGDMLGARFEELRDIHNWVEDKSKCGFCLDTQHLWAAGYDISKWSDI